MFLPSQLEKCSCSVATDCVWQPVDLGVEEGRGEEEREKIRTEERGTGKEERRRRRPKVTTKTPDRQVLKQASMSHQTYCPIKRGEGTKAGRKRYVYQSEGKERLKYPLVSDLGAAGALTSMANPARQPVCSIDCQGAEQSSY